MYTVIAKFHVKPENQPVFKQLADQLGAASSTEGGVKVYQLHRDTTDAEHFATIEIYTEQAAHAFHAETPHVKALFPQMCALCVQEPIIEFYDEI